MKKRKTNPEHCLELRVFFRVKNKDAALQFAKMLGDLIEDEVGGNYLKYRVSLTGKHLEYLENLE